MLQYNDLAGRFLVCSLFHCSVLYSLLNYNLLTIIDIDALSAGLLVEFHAVQRVPSVE